MVLLLYPSAVKTSQQFIEYARPCLGFRRKSFLICRFLLWAWCRSFLFLEALCVNQSLTLIAYRSFFIVLSLILSESVSLGLSINYLRAYSCPLQSTYVSHYQRSINLGVCWLVLDRAIGLRPRRWPSMPRQRTNSMPSIHHDAMQCLRNYVLILLCAKNQWVSAFNLPIF